MKKVWTFLSDKTLSESEILALTTKAENFVKNWTAHENQLAASFQLFENRILIFSVDEQIAGASGCSIDKLLRFVKQAELEFNVQLLNRMLVALEINNNVKAVSVSAIKGMLEAGEISGKTLVYNTAVSNDVELNAWKQTLETTWLNKYL